MSRPCSSVPSTCPGAPTGARRSRIEPAVGSYGASHGRQDRREHDGQQQHAARDQGGRIAREPPRDGSPVRHGRAGHDRRLDAARPRWPSVPRRSAGRSRSAARRPRGSAARRTWRARGSRPGAPGCRAGRWRGSAGSRCRATRRRPPRAPSRRAGSRTAGPSTVRICGSGVLHHVGEDAARRQALGPQGQHELLGEDVERRRAHDARDDAERDERQRDRGQDHVAQVVPDPGVDRRRPWPAAS